MQQSETRTSRLPRLRGSPRLPHPFYPEQHFGVLAAWKEEMREAMGLRDGGALRLRS